MNNLSHRLSRIQEYRFEYPAQNHQTTITVGPQPSNAIGPARRNLSANIQPITQEEAVLEQTRVLSVLPRALPDPWQAWEQESKAYLNPLYSNIRPSIPVDRNLPNLFPTVRTDTNLAVRVTAPTAEYTVFGPEIFTSYNIDAAITEPADTCIITIVAVGAGSVAIRHTPIERCRVHRNRVGSNRQRDAIESVVSPAVHRGFGFQNPRLSC